MKVRTYHLGNRGVRIALLTDLHNKPWETILAQAAAGKPTAIAIAGDLTFRFSKFSRIHGFLTRCAEIAPTYLSLGNHDSLSEKGFAEAVFAADVILLDDAYIDTELQGLPIRIGGLTAPSSRVSLEKRYPNQQWLSGFCDTAKYKILLCHQPDFYPRYLAQLPIELTLAGHAHGGQWRIGSQGIFAPGQGLFPKLTGGANQFENGTLVISRGLSNTTWIPRFFNPREIVMIDI